LEARLLQIAVTLAAVVPVLGGGVGVLRGSGAFGDWAGRSADSQTRYLSGLLLGVGLAFWACVPTISRRGREVRILAFLVVVGGLSRLLGVVLVGDPGRMRWTLAMELVVTPALALWQARD
jgi:multisubunit Na+/H+ antiporter MnhG subunit